MNVLPKETPDCIDLQAGDHPPGSGRYKYYRTNQMTPLRVNIRTLSLVTCGCRDPLGTTAIAVVPNQMPTPSMQPLAQAVLYQQ